MKEEKNEKVSRALSEEEIICVNTAIDAITPEMGEKTVSVLSACANWNNEDADIRKSNRDSMLSHFANIDELKNFLKSEEFETEIAIVRGASKLNTLLNLIISYYTREIKRTSTKKVVVRINGKTYKANKAYIESLAEITDPNQKREQILSHPETEEFVEEIEEF